MVISGTHAASTLPLPAAHDSRRLRQAAPAPSVIPGGKLDLAIQLILTPLIWKLMERRRQWV